MCTLQTLRKHVNSQTAVSTGESFSSIVTGEFLYYTVDCKFHWFLSVIIICFVIIRCICISHPAECFVTTVIFAACQQDMCLSAPSRGSRSVIEGDCSAEPSTSTSSKALPEGGQKMGRIREEFIRNFLSSPIFKCTSLIFMRGRWTQLVAPLTLTLLTKREDCLCTLITTKIFASEVGS